jgi:hypothetical protein
MPLPLGPYRGPVPGPLRLVSPPPPPPPPLTVIQAAPTVEQSTGSLPSSATATVTLPQPTGTGNTLVACVTTTGATTSPAVSAITLGGSADHWQAAVTDPGTVKYGGAIWYDPGCASGQTSVVVSISGGSGVSGEIYVAVYEVAGVLFADQHSTGDAASGAVSWSSGATGTTAQASEIFFGACTASTAIPTVTGAGTWTTQSSGLGALDQVSGFQAVTSTGTATFSGTIPSGGYTALVATFSTVAPAGAGAVPRPLAAPVQAKAIPQRAGSVTRRAGTFQGTGPALKPLGGPVPARVRILPPRGRSIGHAGTFTALAAPSGPPVYPLGHPVAARRLPQRGGDSSTRTGTFSGTGPPLRAPDGPVKAQPPPQRGGRTATRAGTFTAGGPQAGPPIYPLGHPVTARRLPLRGGNADSRAGVFAGTGPPVPPLKQPIGVYRRQPRPPARGRVLSLDGIRAGTGPPVRGLDGPVRGQPQAPVLYGRADSRVGIAVFVPPPPFTIGTLTASGAPSSVLTTAGAASALTAVTAPLAAWTTVLAAGNKTDASPVQDQAGNNVLDEVGGQLR